MKKSLYERALNTILSSRFEARADDFNRDLTDEEVRAEAQYQLEDIPYKPDYADDPKLRRTATRQMKALLKGA